MPITNYPDGLASFGLPLVGGSVPSNVGSYIFVDAVNGVDGNSGGSPDQALATIQAAVNARISNSVICVAAGSYDETVTISRGTGPLTIVGLGNLGDAGIAPTTLAARGMTNNEDDVTLINLGVAGESTADFACFSTGSRLRVVNCKIEGVDTSGAALGIGPGSVASHTAGTTGNAGDINLYNTELAWSFNGLAFVASDYGVPTQVFIDGLRVHNVSGTEMISVPGAFGIGGVRNLMCTNGLFEAMEDGTKPSDFVAVNGTGDTGIITNCSFAIATNAIADLKIATGVMWVANRTEAGISTARPA